MKQSAWSRLRRRDARALKSDAGHMGPAPAPAGRSRREHDRYSTACALGSRTALSRFGQARPKYHERLGERWKKERDQKARKQGCGNATVLVCLDGHPPATAASVATTANATAAPISIGNPLRMNGRSAFAHTNGSTGRIQWTMVTTSPG